MGKRSDLHLALARVRAIYYPQHPSPTPGLNPKRPHRHSDIAGNPTRQLCIRTAASPGKTNTHEETGVTISPLIFPFFTAALQSPMVLSGESNAGATHGTKRFHTSGLAETLFASAIPLHGYCASETPRLDGLFIEKESRRIRPKLACQLWNRSSARRKSSPSM